MVIRNGVDTDTFRPLQNIQPADDVILYVGRFLERKGILDLMETAKALPEYEFWLARTLQAPLSSFYPCLT
jgi:1,2-diacylglycerol-3-alpha-glucose alpha-1,2-glucosyltransferase